jgi:hypothetical protein
MRQMSLQNAGFGVVFFDRRSDMMAVSLRFHGLQLHLARFAIRRSVII